MKRKKRKKIAFPAFFPLDGVRPVIFFFLEATKYFWDDEAGKGREEGGKLCGNEREEEEGKSAA